MPPRRENQELTSPWYVPEVPIVWRQTDETISRSGRSNFLPMSFLPSGAIPAVANLPHSNGRNIQQRFAGGDGLWHGRRLEPYAFPFLRGMLKPVFGLAADANVAKHRGGLFYVVADDVDAGGEAPPSSCSLTHTPCPHTCTMS